MKKLYLCGPVTGLPDFNRSAFAEAREQLRFRLVCVYAPTGMLGVGQQPAPVCARLTLALADETLRQLYATPFKFEPMRDDGLLKASGR